GRGRVAAFDRAREVEEVVEPLLADDRADVLDADAAVVGPASQRRLARLAQEGRGVLARQLNQEARRLVGDRQPFERRALADPSSQVTGAPRRQLDDGG